MTLSPRERRTLVAALQCWINEVDACSPEELADYYPALGAEPLTRDEVEALLVRLLQEMR